MIMSNHFIERYFERVLDCNKISEYSEAVSGVFTDMFDRLSIHQYMAYEHFVGNNINELVLPLGIYRIIIRNDTAISIY
jgi:hypothetical protein